MVGLVVLTAPFTGSCGGSGPSSSTPPATVPLPKPSATPIAGDPFNDASCAIGKGDDGAVCQHTGERLLNVYEEALDYLIEKKPQIFDLQDEYAPGTKAYRVKDKDAYMNGIVAYVRARGQCAERDPDDGEQETVRIKSENDFSEDYDTLIASGHMRRGNGAYRDSCKPSNFPVEREQDAPPIGSGCGRPYPPEVSRFSCKVHMKGPEYYTLDSTPIVGPAPDYCFAIGYTDGRQFCPIRPEGVEDRAACENWRVGKAQDTGRPGPTWRKDGHFCTGPASGCDNHPENQYSLWAYTAVSGGVFTVTAENGATCTVPPF
jgi:hypothetical protein